MARLPLTGQTVCSLYERTPVFDEWVKAGLVYPHECETSLSDVITGLGLKSLCPERSYGIA